MNLLQGLNFFVARGLFSSQAYVSSSVQRCTWGLGNPSTLFRML